MGRAAGAKLCTPLQEGVFDGEHSFLCGSAEGLEGTLRKVDIAWAIATRAFVGDGDWQCLPVLEVGDQDLVAAVLAAIVDRSEKSANVGIIRVSFAAGTFVAVLGVEGGRSTAVGLASSSSTSSVSIAVSVAVAAGFLRAVRAGGRVGLLARSVMVVRVRRRGRGRLGFRGLGIGLRGGLMVVRAAAAGTGVAWLGLAALAVGSAPLDSRHECVLLGEVLDDTARYALVGDVAVAEGGRCRERQGKEDKALVDRRHCYFKRGWW